MRTPVSVRILSDWGEVVEYEITPWGAGRGLQIARKLLGLLKGIGFAMPQAAALDGLMDKDVSTLAGTMLAGLSGGASNALGAIAQGIADAGDDALFKELLDGVVRRINGKGERVCGRGSRPDGFDSIYQANYGELIAATFHVLKANFGPVFNRLGGNDAKG